MSKTINPYFFLYFILISLGRCISVHHISEKLFWSFSSYSWCRFSFALFVTAFRFFFAILPVLNKVVYKKSLQKIKHIVQVHSLCTPCMWCNTNKAFETAFELFEMNFCMLPPFSRIKTNIAKGTTDPGVDYFNQ